MTPENKIKTGFLGLSHNGRRLINLIEGLDQYSISAIGDRDFDNAAKVAKKFEGCKGYDDYRQMIMQNDLDLLVVAEPIYECIDNIRSGIKKKFNIFKLSPAGRDFSEVSELSTLTDSEKVIFSTGNYWRNSPSWENLKNYVQGKKIESPNLIEVQWRSPSDIDQEKMWLLDPKLAGGGVLLYHGYQAIDIIVSNFGLPEQVYALNVSNAPDRQQRTYLTEDTSVVMMRFSESLTANLVLSRVYGPEEKTVKVYGKNINVEVSDNYFKTFNNQAVAEQEFEFFDDPDSLLKAGFNNLAANIKPEDDDIEPPCICRISNNLPVMAVIEAAYLSSKTLMPEEPTKILNLAQNESAKAWLK